MMLTAQTWGLSVENPLRKWKIYWGKGGGGGGGGGGGVDGVERMWGRGSW